jgi:glycosyltransferase involved in cell wall biosynthesis
MALPRKTICFVLRYHSSVALGGAELQAYKIATELVRRGWEVHYVSEKKGEPGDSIDDSGVILHWLEERKSGQGLFNWVRLSRLLKEIQPGVIYMRTTLEYTGIVAILARRYGIKYVWASASDRHCQRGKYRESWRDYRNPINKVFKCILFWISDRLVSYGIRHADVAIVQSKQQKALLETNYRKTSEIIKNAHHIPESNRRTVDRETVLWLANIKPKKRLDLFIELAARCVDLPIKFQIIGEDKSSSLKGLSATMGTGNLEYVGAVTPDEVGPFFEQACIFVNTSDSGYEGFPNTFIEAWMRGVPVVSLNTDPDNVIQRHGLGFHSGSFEKMVNNVRFLLSDEDARRHFGENGYRYVKNEHDITKIVGVLENIFESALREKQGFKNA